MKKLMFLTLVLLFSSCGQQNQIKINATVHPLKAVECYVSGTEGDPVEYSLLVKFEATDSTDETFNTISFSVADPNNDPNNLLSVGTHPASGNNWDGIDNSLQDSTYFWSGESITQDNFEIVIKTLVVNASMQSFIAEGYVNIKQAIHVLIPDVGVDDTYPAQKVNFHCSNGRYFF